MLKGLETVKESKKEGAETLDKTLLLHRSPIKEVEESAVEYEAGESRKQ